MKSLLKLDLSKVLELSEDSLDQIQGSGRARSNRKGGYCNYSDRYPDYDSFYDWKNNQWVRYRVGCLQGSAGIHPTGGIDNIPAAKVSDDQASTNQDENNKNSFLRI